MKQICYILTNIHKLGVIHADLKLENILLTQHKTVKTQYYIVTIVDFGSALFMHNNDSNQLYMGTPRYIYPDIIDYFQCIIPHHKITTNIDLWNIGIVFYLMLFGVLFGNFDDKILKLIREPQQNECFITNKRIKFILYNIFKRCDVKTRHKHNQHTPINYIIHNKWFDN
jgi:serine/threonine protein kinase